MAHLSPGESVLYVGVGTGDNALAAARAGARVTCIDLSPAMLKRAEARFTRAGLTGDFICADALEHHPVEGYDAVALNFFLNFFSEGSMQRALARLAGLVKPGGKLMIADYAYPRGNWLVRLPQVIYWRITNVFFWAVSLGGFGALHPIYDYVSYFPALGLETESIEYFRPLRVGPVGLLFDLRRACPSEIPPQIRGPASGGCEAAVRCRLRSGGLAADDLVRFDRHDIVRPVFAGGRFHEDDVEYLVAVVQRKADLDRGKHSFISSSVIVSGGWIRRTSGFDRATCV